MGSINVNIAAKPNPRSTISDPVPRPKLEEKYVYKDVKLDVKIGSTLGNYPANLPDNRTDIEDIRDIAAIKQSIVNIFNTTPGQKLLNPYLGLNLSKFLFEPITKQTGSRIARAILAGLGQQEPRIALHNIQVLGLTEDQAYHISFIVVFPQLNNDKINFNGLLTTDGFKFA